MGWIDRINAKKEEEKLPPRLREKTPEQIVTELEAADKLKNDLELEKAARREQDEKVTQIETEFNQVKERLAAAELKAKPAPKQEDGTEATSENILADPKKVLDAHTATLQSVTIQNAATTSRMLAQQQLDNADSASDGKSMDGRLFRAWSGEIDSESRKYQAIQLMRPEAWLGIFWYLKGTHADELRDPEMRKKKYNFLEPSAASGGSTNGDSKPKDGPEGLTDQEKHVADKMGVSYENYAKRKKAMVMVNV